MLGSRVQAVVIGGVAAALLSLPGAVADTGGKGKPSAPAGAKVSTWHATYTPGGPGNDGVVSSQDAFRGRTVIKSLEARVTGDLSACDQGVSVDVFVDGQGLAGLSARHPTTATVLTERLLVSKVAFLGLDDGARLHASGICIHDDGQGGTGVPMPAYEISLTFEWTDPQPLTQTAFQ